MIHKIEEFAASIRFSGAVLVTDENDNIVWNGAFGYSNRADQIPNQADTRFGIASGCKLFTAIAVCQLIEQGKLSLDSKLSDCLDIPLPNFSPEITVYHLLSHSSGIPDYFDEEVMDDFEDLWKTIPMYTLRNGRNFLPLFQDERMKFQPGERFHYNNAGFVVLGLIVEQQAGMPFRDYVQQFVLEPSGMQNSGYFPLDRLPANTAYGYIDEEDGTWRTNQYAIPIQGYADGGAYLTAPDMIKLWRSLMNNTLLAASMTEKLLALHMHVPGSDLHYGLGVWITKKNEDVFKYHVMGYDPGVNFRSAYYPATGHTLVVASNAGGGAFEMMQFIEEELLK
ncbi:serine hydrolase domain-containing protein [Paenibacillus sp. NPDC093718]|uniref:serine hydrolase domain-containing protein n=1 Tax=Paenibacillus sp. NPDC093718 TaxID=3390601 RepID=UPI003D01AA70